MKDVAKSVGIEEEVKRSYLDYAMSVIIGRALPDVRDGLKPVHRRILYSMYEMGNTYNRPHKKSARVVGDVIGKYHPHGDAAVYDALVRMAQDFSMRYPLIDGHGNFGSMDGDPPAAMRYTEVRMSKIATLFLEDIDKDTVDFRPNYDGSAQEPEVLPTPFPNLLMNGSSGIAVGMATSIPPHNLSELIDALLLVLKKREATVEEIMDILPGPDFPTGGIIVGRDGIKKAYTTGRGSVTIRSRIEEEENRLIVREIPYMVNKSQLLERIALLVSEKKVEGISDIRDESDREGVRVIIELKKGAQKSVIINRLLKMTPLETSFNIILLGISKGQPKIFTIKELLEEFLEFRTEVITRRTEFILKKSKERLHILEGLRIALDNIDRVVEIIKSSKSPKDARIALMDEFSLSEIQAQAILDMKLQRLTALEKEKILEEHRETEKRVKECMETLSSKEKLLGIVEEELIRIKKEFGDERRTTIEDIREDISIEDLIPVEDMLVTITERGYIKRTPIKEYRSQRRGGKGKKGMQVSESDLVTNIFHASTHDWLLVFTSKGKVHWLKVYEIPQGPISGKGKNIVNLIPVDEDERISSFFKTKDLSEDIHILFATKLGVVKKTHLSEFSRPRRGGITALTLKEGDRLIQTLPIRGGERVFMATRNGMVNIFPESEVRSMGRTAYGVRGIKLYGEDEVVGVGTVEDGDWIVFITDKGYAKRVEESEFRKTHRGSTGVRGIKLDEKSGHLSKVLRSRGDEGLVVIANSGKSIKINVKEVPPMKRFSRGVKIIDLSPDERVVSATLIERNVDGN